MNIEPIITENILCKGVDCLGNLLGVGEKSEVIRESFEDGSIKIICKYYQNPIEGEHICINPNRKTLACGECYYKKNKDYKDNINSD